MSWILDRLSCSISYGKNNQIVYHFKEYLLRFILSVDPNFEEDDLLQAMYCTANDDEEYAASVAAIIITRTSEAAHAIEVILNKRRVTELFPGICYNNHNLG